PSRSRLKTARNIQPWPWKSANCVRSMRELISSVPVFSRKVGSDQLPRTEEPSGFESSFLYSSSEEMSRCFEGYMPAARASVSLSHQRRPRYVATMLLPGCMWHVMHCEVGIWVVNCGLMGGPGSPFV